MKLRFIFLMALVISCGGKNDGDNFIIHPTQSNQLDETKITNVIFQQSKNSLLKNDIPNFKSIIREEEYFEIGKLDGTKEEIFSNIDQVVIKKENLYILDRHNVKISIFSSRNGEYLGTVGNKGRGPGELQQPNSITFAEDRIFVSDRAFSIKSGSYISGKIEEIKEFETDMKTPPEQICATDKFLIVKSTTRNDSITKTLHKFDFEERNVKLSFGDAYISDDLFVQQLLSEGIIACDRKGQNIVLAKYLLPYIYSYDKNGRLSWVSKINDYRPLKFREEIGRGMSTRWNKEDFVYDEYSSIFFYSNHLILQIRSYSNSFREEQLEIENKGIETYLIDSSSGKGTYLGNDLPEIKFVNDKFFVINAGKKYPAIQIFKL